MADHPARRVPKVHPATRPVEPEDPMMLTATATAGDPQVMLRCLVQEYAWMGWNTDQILSLFHNPFYPVLCAMREACGENEIRQRVDAVVRETGVFRFQATVHEPVPPCSEPPLVQISIPDMDRPNHV